MRRIRLFALLAGIAMLTACASAPSVEAMKADSANFKLPAGPYSDYATVYVVRPSAIGFAVKFSVYVDQKDDKYFAGSTKGNQYIYFAMAPGTRQILSQAENLATCTINAEKGKVYFLQQTPRMGILFARNDLTVIQDFEGKYWIKNLNPGTLKEKK
jgi:Protein of unknown function (DUF2846)